MNLTSLRLVIAVAALAVLGLTLMNRAQPLPVNGTSGGGIAGLQTGARVVVYLRGDVSGVAFTDRSATGFLQTREGTVVSANEHWLVLDGRGGQSTIPLDAIAMIDSAVKK
jgi:hypothetical protein